MNKLELNKLNLEDRKQEIRTLFNYGLIDAGTYVDLMTDVYAEELRSYQLTDKEISEYYS